MNLRRQPGRRWSPVDAFTLIEVMIAITIFFMAMFAILGVFSSNLHAAMLLRKSGPTAGMAAAEMSLTNKLEEGDETGNFGDAYTGYQWRAHCEEVATNGLFRVDFQVVGPEGNVDSALSVLYYRPDSHNPQDQVGRRAAFMNR